MSALHALEDIKRMVESSQTLPAMLRRFFAPDEPVGWWDPKTGICFNVERHVCAYASQVPGLIPPEIYEIVHRDMRDMFKSWPKFSGDSSYPIPGKPNPVAAFHTTNRKFSRGSQNGAMRLELLDYLIKSYKKELGHARSI